MIPKPQPPATLPEVTEAPLTAKQAAATVGVSLPAFWRAVAAGRLPAPYYPVTRTPRWFGSELRTAMFATRALPAEAKQARRQAKLNNTP